MGINVAQLFSKDAKVPSIEDIFPHLFREEPKEVPKGKLSKSEANFLAGLLNHLSDKVDIDIKDKDM